MTPVYRSQGNAKHYVSRGYVYGTNPNTPLERSAEPLDWLHFGIRTLMIGGTLAVIAHAFGAFS